MSSFIFIPFRMYGKALNCEGVKLKETSLTIFHTDGLPNCACSSVEKIDYYHYQICEDTNKARNECSRAWTVKSVDSNLHSNFCCCEASNISGIKLLWTQTHWKPRIYFIHHRLVNKGYQYGLERTALERMKNLYNRSVVYNLANMIWE